MKPATPPKLIIVTTGNDIAGYRISEYLGVVRGIVVRSPGIAQGFLGGLKQIVGGNIEGFTRTMTTAVVLETSKGNLPLAMGLGIILVAIVVLINAVLWTTRAWSERQAG